MATGPTPQERMEATLAKAGIPARNGSPEWQAAYLASYYRILEQVEGPDHPAVVQHKLDCAA